MPNQLSLAGAQETKPVHFAPIFTNRFFQGLWTQRNPLRDAGSTRIEEKFYGTRGDAMIAGSNVEITTRLTAARRPGSSVYNSNTFDDVDAFYEFRLFNTNTEEIKVMVDTATGGTNDAGVLYDGTGPSNQIAVWEKSAGAGQTYMQYVANILYFGNGVDQKKWVQTLDTWTASTSYAIDDLSTFIIDTNGNLQQLIATVQTTISHVAVSSDLLTLTVAASSGLTVGDQYPIWGLTTATWLNGSIVTVVSKPSSTTFTADFTHANYSANDTGAVAVLVGGSPETGSSVSWNSSSTAPNNITIDNTAIWANRGSPIENWGIVGPTVAPSFATGVGSSGWQENTFYANNEVVVDSNGNLQQVTTAGTTGSTVPTWATTDGSTTTDGTVIWTQLETAAELTWAASTAYTSPKNFLVASAAGTNCLFQGVASSYPVIEEVGGVYVTDNFYMHQHQFAGQCELRNPTDGGNNPGSGSYPLLTPSVTTGNSVLFNPPQLAGTDPDVPMQQATLNQAGQITGYTTPYSGATQNYNMIVLFTLTFPASGNYTFNINHDDGMFWGIGPSSGSQPTYFSGPNSCPAPVATVTALEGYPVIGANNYSNYNTDQFVVNVPAAGSYPVEIDYCQSQTEQTLCFYCQGQTPIPGTPKTGATEPVWPAWSTSWAFAPAYPSVNETNNAAPGGGSGPGPLSWNNLGPTADYAWRAKTQTILTPTIIDSNNNTEDPYEAGVTGTVEPTWATGINQLTPDNPNLTWINQGPGAAPPAGTVSTYNGGWSYCIALVNSLTDTVSNAGPVTVATGNFVGSTGVTISGGLPASIDPQVDYVAIFRTQDGGATYYLIPGIANSVYTTTLAQYQANGYVDTTLDADLNILLEPALAEQNTPPPTGIINLTYHLGRVFGSVGNTVYYSDGPDTPIGNGNEAFPPLNTCVFPSLVKRIVPTSIGAIVFTVSDIYLIGGSGTSSSPIFTQPYATGIGLLSYNALAINGTTIYLFTADSQVVSLDPSSGLSQIGFPIGDQFILSNWSPANAYVTWHVSGSTDHALYVSDGQTGWFRMTPTASPESGLTWSPFATITGGCKAVQSIEVSPGVHNLLIGPASTGEILKRDLTTYADNGTPYPATFTIGSIVLAQPGQVAELAFITTDASAIGSQPQLSVLVDEISGNAEALPRFTNDPPQLFPPMSLYSQRFYFSQSQQPAICRHLQLKITWPSESAGNELLSITLFGGYLQES
jgi:hypothetical protein